MPKTFKIHPEDVEVSDCGNEAACIVATIFNRELPNKYRVGVSYDGVVGHWFWDIYELYYVFGRHALSDELAELASAFDDYGNNQKDSFYQKFKDKEYEYPSELWEMAEMIKQMKEENDERER